MHCTARYGNARFKRIDTERIQHELEARKIVIVTGFQGINKYDDYSTLGRGGSDTTQWHWQRLFMLTSVRSIRMWTVYTQRIRELLKNARKIDEIIYDEMLELATSGAKVLHNRSVEMAKKYGVELVVRSSLTSEEGTVVKEVVKMEKMLITGVAADRNTVRISAIGVKDEPGIAFKLFNTLARNNINVDIILQSVGRNGTKRIFPLPCQRMICRKHCRFWRRKRTFLRSRRLHTALM